ncbi:MAG: hypothetical protein HQ475_11770 [SAR202 cluster bacterium]|nr:hypothetical protein [SAR202 cluster bacterium]
MTILSLRALRNQLFRTANSEVPDVQTPASTNGQPNSWLSSYWALVTLTGILAIAGLEGYALSLGIDGTALRAALTSIGVLGGAGFSRILK